MSLKVLTKLVALLTALTATVVAIYWLKSGHMSSFWTSLGFKTGERLNWCSERVRSVYHIDSGSKLLEKDGKWWWVSKSSEPKELDYLRVEKWFAMYCQIPFENVPDTSEQDLASPTPMFEVEFVDSDRATIFDAHYTDTSFMIRKKEFQSETLRNAFKELLAFGREIK